MPKWNRLILAAAIGIGTDGVQAEVNFNRAWPPEPYLSAAISTVRTGLAIQPMTVGQATIDRICAAGSPGCSYTGPLGRQILLLGGLSPRDRCIVLIHEVAHGLGWKGNHEGGTWAPSECPL